ncbi:hypothetical protein BGX38DRAFT_475456 [Terfezia claveryi]|nr:hypothetical protein BGX38DRAFT_475456 [Terfezia claveryi]
MSGNISPPASELGYNEKGLGIILIVVFVTVIVVCVCIHCFLRRQRRLALATNQVGEGGLERNAIAESDIPLINVRDSVLHRIAGLSGSLRSVALAAPNGQSVTSPTPGHTPGHAASVPDASRAANPRDTPQKRVSFAVLPIPARESAITGHGHLSGLTDESNEHDTTPPVSSVASDHNFAIHGLSTPIELDDGFGPYPFPPSIPPSSTSPSLLSTTDFEVKHGTSSSSNSKKRYSTIPVAAIEAARSSVAPTCDSTSKRNSTIKLVGQQDGESPGCEAAKLGGRVVQNKVSGNWVVYDYSPKKGPSEEDVM